jgi:solute carrier family 25 phosphate transporter 23/24/25/41
MTSDSNDRKMIEIQKFLQPYENKEMNLQEFSDVFKNLKIPKQELEKIFSTIDLNKNNKIDITEVLSFFEAQEKKLRDLFDIIDDDKNGKISIKELQLAFSNLNIEKTNDENFFSDLMKIYDTNHDGMIDFDEWKNILMFVPDVNLNYAVKWSMNTAASLSFMMDSVPPQIIKENSKEGSLKNFIRSFFSGGFSAAVARTMTAPLDRLKTLYQVNYVGAEKPPGIFKGLSLIVQQDGVKGLFKGNFVNTLKASPDSSIKLAIFELLKNLLKKEDEIQVSAVKLFIAGSISGFVACFCVFPMDVIKTRIAASPSGHYSGISDVIHKMKKNEGGVSAFFQGFQAASLAALFNSGLNLTIYDILKKTTFKVLKKDKLKDSLPISVFMSIGAISAAISTTILYPFNLVSTRLIMQGMKKDTKKEGMFQMARNIYASKGISSFYKGFAPTTTKIFFGNGISFGVYEFTKKYFSGK